MIEKIQKSSNIGKTLEYLEKGKNSNDNQIRGLYSINGYKISAQKAKEIASFFKASDVRIYNPETDQLSIEDLHKMAKDIIDARSKQAGKKLGAVYAIHYRPDGSNKHIHIAFFGDEKSLKKSGRGKEWINKLDEIELKYTKDEKEREKVIERNKKRIDTLASKPTGTQKIDNFIWRHLNKKTGHFSYRQFAINIEKSKMNGRAKEYYLKRVEQRLRGLEKLGISKSIDGKNWQIDIEKYKIEREKIKLQAKVYISTEKEQKDLKNSLAKTKEIKNKLYDENGLYFSKLKQGLLYKKSDISLRIRSNYLAIEQLRLEETQIKLRMLENKLLQYGSVNPLKAIEKAMQFKREIPLDLIRKSVELQIMHLEKLVQKGLVKKEGNIYKLAVSKEEFIRYKNSMEASEIRKKTAKKHLKKGTAKKVLKRIDKTIEKNTRVTFKSFGYEYFRTYKYIAVMRKDIGWQMFAFTAALTWAVGKSITKMTLRLAWIASRKSLEAVASRAKEIQKIHQNHKEIVRLKQLQKEKRTLEIKERSIMNISEEKNPQKQNIKEKSHARER